VLPAFAVHACVTAVGQKVWVKPMLSLQSADLMYEDKGTNLGYTPTMVMLTMLGVEYCGKYRIPIVIATMVIMACP